MAPCSALTRLGGLTDEQRVEVEVVPGRLDLEIRLSAHRAAEGDQQLDQNSPAIRLGLRLNRPNDLACKAVERLFDRWCDESDRSD